MKDGYYWIRLNESDKCWQPGEFFENTWGIIGSDQWFDSVAEVGDPIISTDVKDYRKAKARS